MTEVTNQKSLRSNKREVSFLVTIGFQNAKIIRNKSSVVFVLRIGRLMITQKNRKPRSNPKYM